jgi:hypothetical protein
VAINGLIFKYSIISSTMVAGQVLRATIICRTGVESYDYKKASVVA